MKPENLAKKIVNDARLVDAELAPMLGADDLDFTASSSVEFENFSVPGTVDKRFEQAFDTSQELQVLCGYESSEADALAYSRLVKQLSPAAKALLVKVAQHFLKNSASLDAFVSGMTGRTSTGHGAGFAKFVAARI